MAPRRPGARFHAGLSLLTGIVFSLAPALQASRPDLVAASRRTRRGAAAAARVRLRNLLVVTQVALSLVVLIGAGFVREEPARAAGDRPGLRAGEGRHRVLRSRLTATTSARGRQFMSDLFERVAALPGVEAVSFGQYRRVQRPVLDRRGDHRRLSAAAG